MNEPPVLRSPPFLKGTGEIEAPEARS